VEPKRLGFEEQGMDKVKEAAANMGRKGGKKKSKRKSNTILVRHDLHGSGRQESGIPMAGSQL